jgi:hypothetical protein
MPLRTSGDSAKMLGDMRGSICSLEFVSLTNLVDVGETCGFLAKPPSQPPFFGLCK